MPSAVDTTALQAALTGLAEQVAAARASAPAPGDLGAAPPPPAGRHLRGHPPPPRPRGGGPPPAAGLASGRLPATPGPRPGGAAGLHPARVDRGREVVVAQRACRGPREPQR